MIRALDLKPHPEGGHYRQTFQDTRTDANGRAASTAIYFLLARGERSHWHRVDAVEVWHYHAGAPLVLEMADEAGAIRRMKLGPDIAMGERPQGVVPMGHWQAAESPRRLDPGRLHRRAGISVRGIRDGGAGLEARAANAERSCPWRRAYRRPRPARPQARATSSPRRSRRAPGTGSRAAARGMTPTPRMRMSPRLTPMSHA